MPWRKTRNPYRILVSEVMLQQTQVERVIPFYLRFTKRFPTIRSLARASLSDVLRAWQGLGYNRRAKMLHEAANIVIEKYGGKFPRKIKQLEKLPGVGPYTARAVAAFAFNQDCILVETNIRTVMMSEFLAYRSKIRTKGKRKISDVEIGKILARVLPKGKARTWYSALMDYGAHLKRSGVRLNATSAHYTKQAKFAGSAREARGMILRTLLTKPVSGILLTKTLGASRIPQMRKALAALIQEGLVIRTRKKFSLSH